jgi:hypothetical protein
MKEKVYRRRVLESFRTDLHPSGDAYSIRNARIGPALEAAAAGNHTASNATPVSTSITITNVAGSQAWTLNQRPAINRVTPNGPAMPSARPRS